MSSVNIYATKIFGIPPHFLLRKHAGGSRQIKGVGSVGLSKILWVVMVGYTDGSGHRNIGVELLGHGIVGVE